MLKEAAIKQKVAELTDELKLSGRWKRIEPEWVNRFRDVDENNNGDFYEWLQFIYLPNLISGNASYSYASKHAYIAPQAVQFLGKEAEKTKLLQLLVELDALID